MCRDEHCSSAFAKQTIARQGDLPCVAAVRHVSICLRQIAFVPNAGRAMLVPTQRHGKNVGTRIARPRLRSKQSPGRAISLRCCGTARLDLPPANCIRSECRTSNARPYTRKVKKDAPAWARLFASFDYWAFLASLAAFLAVSTREAKAVASAIASSERALRFISMPACFRPYMNQL